jgi:hypothetical protein
MPERKGPERVIRHSLGSAVKMPGKPPAEDSGGETLPAQPARPRIAKALLIGESRQGSSYLAKRLQERGFRCEFATSWEDIRSFIRDQDFDLVLSPIKLRGASLLPLLDWLAGSAATLFYSQAVEEGCWWLPALRHGEGCFGSSALRPSEFMSALDETIGEVISHLPTPSAGQKACPGAPPQAIASALAKRKAAG